MRFPLSVFLHILEEFDPVILNTRFLGNESFSGALFLKNGESLDPDYCCICTGSEFSRIAQERLSMTFLCFGKSADEFKCGPRNKSTLIFLPIDIMSDALNKLTVTFEKLRQWERELEELAWADAAVQNMVDISEPFLTNPLLIFDPSHKVIACSKLLSSENEFFCDAVSNGFLPLRLLKRLADRGFLSEEMVFPEIVTVAKPNIADCIMLIHGISTSGRQGYLLQFCENEPPSDYEKFLLHTLISQIRRLFSKGRKGLDENKRYSDYFIEELLNRTFTSPELLAERSKLVGLFPYGHYRLYEVMLGAELGGEVVRVCEILRAMDFNYKISVYRNAIILLRRLPAHADMSEQKTDDLKRIQSMLKSYNAKIGISDEFTELSAAYDAHVQARCAIDLGMLMEPDQDIYYYGNYYIYHICAVCEQSVNLRSLVCKHLLMLEENDNKTGSDNIELLDTFLANGRNASTTAKIMNLHRNSVLYRVRKIEEIMKMDLDQAPVRARLIVSLHILRYLERKKLQTEFAVEKDY